VRTPHLTLVDNHGKTLFEAQCIDDYLSSERLRWYR
jgi:hypothetical protein